MKIRAFLELLDFLGSEAKDLIDVLQSVGVATHGKVGKGYQKGSDILDREVWPSLNEVDNLFPKHLEQLDVLWNAAELLHWRILPLLTLLGSGGAGGGGGYVFFL